MSITKIKELSSNLKAGELLNSVVSNPVFGNTNVRVELEQLFDLIGLNSLSLSDLVWVAFGTIGQLVFFSRWIIQWFSSENVF